MTFKFDLSFISDGLFFAMYLYQRVGACKSCSQFPAVHLQYTDLKSWLSSQTFRLEIEPGKLVALLPTYSQIKKHTFNSKFKCTLYLFIHCFQAVKSAFFLLLQRFNGE